MTAAAVERLMVEPAFVSLPSRASSLGEQVTAVSASVGRYLDAEQRFAVDVLTSRKADGTPAALEGALITCRQNMKTFVGEDIVLTYLVEPESDVQLIVWSAHEFATAQETFRHFDDLCASYSHLSRRVKRVLRGNGEEAIEFVGGRRLIFRARTKAGGRGLTGDVVVLDEGFALQPAHLGALLPTLSTRRRAQVLYLSSAGLGHSAVLRGVRDRGRAGGTAAPAYVEWCAPGSLEAPGCSRPDCQHGPGTPGCVLDDEDLWLLANPALGTRITVDFVRQERAAMPPLEFARERLGWWDAPEDAESPPITVEGWSPLAAEMPEKSALRRLTFGVHVSAGAAWAEVHLAAWRGETPWLEVVEYRRGTDWLAARLRELKAKYPGCRVVVEAAGASAALLPDLKVAGVVPDQELSPRDMAAGCVGLQKAVDDRALAHDGSQSVAIALGGAAKRDVGDGMWVWMQRKSSTDIAPIVGATIALRGLVTWPQVDYGSNVW